MAIQSNSDQGATVPEDPILRIVKEQNSAMFTAAKETVRQRILREALREAVAELGRPDAIAEQALGLVDDTHETLHTAVDELKQRLIEKVAHRSMQDLADAEATARQARACIEENHEAILEARRLLKRHLLGEMIQRSTDELADPQAAAHVAKALIRDDNPSVLGAVDELKQRLIAEIVQRSTDELADAEAVARRAHALIMISPEHEVILAAVDKLKEQILQTIVRESLTKINDEVGGTSRPTGPPEARPDGPAEPYVMTPQALKRHLHDLARPDDAVLQTVVQQPLAKISDDVCGLGELPTPKAVGSEAGSVEAAGAVAQSKSRGPDAPGSPPKMQRRKAANGYPEDQEIPPEAAPSAHLAQAHYVHGIVAHRGRGLVEALAAIGSETIYRPYVIPFKTVAAVASRVPGALTEDDGWKALNGVQAGLLEHLSQKGAAVLPMYAETLYASEADLVATLAAHTHTLEVHLGELSGKQEWAVKIYCDPERIKQAVHSTDASIDAFLGQILVDVHEWSARGPAEELKAVQEGMDLSLAELLETVQLSCQQGVHRALQGISEDSRLASSSEEEPVFGQSRMVLSASYLVAESEAEAFRAELERLAAEYERLGLVYYIGGPHPPCRFTVRGAPEL